MPPHQLLAPAVVVDMSDACAADPDFLLEIEHVQAWQDEHGPLPEGGWLLYRTGWDVRSGDQAAFLNADDRGPHTPGVSAACARWLAEQTPLLGLGTETVGTDAGGAHAFDPPFPCHSFFLGAGKYGLTQLQRLADLPPTGTVLLTAPLPVVGGWAARPGCSRWSPGEGRDGRGGGRARGRRAGRRRGAHPARQWQLRGHSSPARGGRPRHPAAARGAVLTAADAVARVRGGFAVATLHQGPGLTNAVTGLAEAVKSRTPLLVLAADTAGAAVRSNFRLDQASVAASVGAGVERLHGPASALEDTARAVHRALTERRPVVLMMPLDVQAAALPEPALPSPRALPGPVRPDRAAVAAAADLLAAAQRPVLLAGRGATGHADLLEELAAATGALLATTAVAAGCSPAARTTWASRAASPRRGRPSCSPPPTWCSRSARR